MLFEHTTNPEQRDNMGQSVIHLVMVGADAKAISDLNLSKQMLRLPLKYCSGLGIEHRNREGKMLLLYVTNYDSRHG
ncbi:hypothetical protein J1614_003383 [Plenodomus biglobosus]|nr:hypothetical protein J1614_003383 [Plenodomus biglobosus]